MIFLNRIQASPKLSQMTPNIVSDVFKKTSIIIRIENSDIKAKSSESICKCMDFVIEPN